MPIVKNFITGNGLSNFHKVVKAELAGDMLKLQVHSYPSQESGTDANLLWQEYPNLPLTALDVNDPYGSLERALISTEGSPFHGGTYIPEAQDGDLETQKARKWAEIKSARDAQESAGFAVEGVGTFDSDSESRNRITGTAIAAKIAKDASQPFNVEWTLADNTAVMLDADQVISVGFAMLTHITSTHEKGRNLRSAIVAAEDVDSLNAITW